uniref:BAG domain-containing protein n=1 Tax=Latimeria chalumnae TaxID=7897 RepID=H3B5T6_LATCH
ESSNMIHTPGTEHWDKKGSKFNRSVSMAGRSERLLEALDQLERRVAELREDVAALEDEKFALLDTLKQTRESLNTQGISEGESEEISLTLDRLIGRTQVVRIELRFVRSPPQEEALQQVDTIMEELQQELRGNPAQARAQLHACLNACKAHGAEGHADHKFQSLLIGCALEDQKRVRQRLESLAGNYE